MRKQIKFLSFLIIIKSMERKTIFYIAFAAILGGIMGSLFTAGSFAVSASTVSLQDIISRFFGGYSPASTSTIGEHASLYVPTVDYEEKIISAVERSEPGVVSVIISKLVPVVEQCSYDPFGDLPPELRPFFGGDSGFTVPCEKGRELQEVGGGSGFVIDKSGLIVTNKHVVFDTKAEYTVLTNDGKKHKAEVLARDPALDLAVLKIQANGLNPLKLGDSDAVKLGQTVIAIGNALGEFRNTVSVGAISGLSRNITAGSGGKVENIEGLIQTDAAINPGNSGGPLLNLKGEIIGINTAVAQGAENIGFAIPINQAKRAINSIEKHGRIIVSYLGVRYIVLNEERAKKEERITTHGALVRGGEDGPAVIKDSPAAKAGVLAEDIILELNSTPVTETRSLSGLIQEHQVGETITLKILRGEKELELKVILEERPAL